MNIENLRNLRRIRFASDAPVILLSGGNGAGKTTFLEAIYLLARGRTFRGRKAGPLTSSGESGTNIEGVCKVHSDLWTTLVFRKDGARSLLLVNNSPVLTADRDQMPLAVKLVGENAQALLEGDPNLRRLFLDWNMFHVEHRYGRVRKDFHRALLQRNAALRNRGRGLGSWNDIFVTCANEIDARRERFFLEWRRHYLRLASSFSFLDGGDLQYRRGWTERKSLEEVLEANSESEQSRGFTLAGPHRADVVLLKNSAPGTFSRGQGKVIVCLLQLAAESVHLDHGLNRSIWLLDDLEAELDREMFRSLWELFGTTSSQRFLTRVSAKLMKSAPSWSSDAAMFHVEHGRMMNL